MKWTRRRLAILLIAPAVALTLVSIGFSWAVSAREPPDPVIADVSATAVALGMDPEALRGVLARVDAEPFRAGDDRSAALAVWFRAHKGRFSGASSEVAPFLVAIREYRVIPRHDPLAVEDPGEVDRGTLGFWCLAQAWHEAGVFGAPHDEIIAQIERAADDRDDILRMSAGLVARVMIDRLGDDAPPGLRSVHDRLMENDLIEKMVNDKIAAWGEGAGSVDEVP